MAYDISGLPTAGVVSFVEKRGIFGKVTLRQVKPSEEVFERWLQYDLDNEWPTEVAARADELRRTPTLILVREDGMSIQPEPQVGEITGVMGEVGWINMLSDDRLIKTGAQLSFALGYEATSGSSSLPPLISIRDEYGTISKREFLEVVLGPYGFNYDRDVLSADFVQTDDPLLQGQIWVNRVLSDTKVAQMRTDIPENEAWFYILAGRSTLDVGGPSFRQEKYLLVKMRRDRGFALGARMMIIGRDYVSSYSTFIPPDSYYGPTTVMLDENLAGLIDWRFENYHTPGALWFPEDPGVSVNAALPEGVPSAVGNGGFKRLGIAAFRAYRYGWPEHVLTATAMGAVSKVDNEVGTFEIEDGYRQVTWSGKVLEAIKDTEEAVVVDDTAGSIQSGEFRNAVVRSAFLKRWNTVPKDVLERTAAQQKARSEGFDLSDETFIDNDDADKENLTFGQVAKRVAGKRYVTWHVITYPELTTGTVSFESLSELGLEDGTTGNYVAIQVSLGSSAETDLDQLTYEFVVKTALGEDTEENGELLIVAGDVTYSRMKEIIDAERVDKRAHVFVQTGSGMPSENEVRSHISQKGAQEDRVEAQITFDEYQKLQTRESEFNPLTVWDSFIDMDAVEPSDKAAQEMVLFTFNVAPLDQTMAVAVGQGKATSKMFSPVT
jgi:hypothetical protein